MRGPSQPWPGAGISTRGRGLQGWTLRPGLCCLWVGGGRDRLRSWDSPASLGWVWQPLERALPLTLVTVAVISSFQHPQKRSCCDLHRRQGTARAQVTYLRVPGREAEPGLTQASVRAPADNTAQLHNSQGPEKDRLAEAAAHRPRNTVSWGVFFVLFFFGCPAAYAVLGPES